MNSHPPTEFDLEENYKKKKLAMIKWKIYTKHTDEFYVNYIMNYV